MLRYTTYQANRNDKFNGLWYARPVIEQTLTLRDLAEHMASHASGFSEAQLLGVMTAMVACIKEMVLEGKNVKIDDLAIFSCGINSIAAKTEEEFTAANIRRVHLRARATGRLANARLFAEASIKRATAVIKPKRKSKVSAGEGE